MNPNERNELDPQLQSDSDILRAARQRERYGPDTCWDKEFAPVDDSTERARTATQKLRDHLAASGSVPGKPMRFSITVAGRSVPIQVREQDGEFSCTMPTEIAPGHYEYRTLLASSYDGLIGAINRVLSSGPRIRDLSEQERIELARACTRADADLSAVVTRYLQLRLLGSVDDDMLNSPRFLDVCNDSVLFVFVHTTPDFPNTVDAIEFVKKFAAGRPLTLALARAGFKAFKAQQNEESAENIPSVSQAEIESASDKELRESMRALTRARADADRKRQALIYGRG